MSPAIRLVAVFCALSLSAVACKPIQIDKTGSQVFASPQADPITLSPDGSLLYVANTTSNTVSVVDTGTNTVVAEIPVGLEPVSVAVRPDGQQLWVSNHVSDSVSVVDLRPSAKTFRRVIATIELADPVASGGVSQFDEPIDIAFDATQGKAYVVLSSRNEIAVIDSSSFVVLGSIAITAQEPRAIQVRDGRLYVAAFESTNQTELSACLNPDGSPGCTLDIVNELGNAAAEPNLPGIPKNIAVDPNVPDRDLFIYDTSNDSLITSVRAVGTLLYGLAVSSVGDVYVTNTEARNGDLDGNGLAAPAPDGLGLGLADLENRLFRNRVTRVDCTGTGCVQLAVSGDIWEFEPPLPAQPAAGDELATPYAIAISDDDSLLVMTAAASSRIASVNPATGLVLDRLDVGAIPRGLTMRPAGGGSQWVYVLNTLGNSVSVVLASAAGVLTPITTIPVGNDPTPENERLGRIAFNDANASSTGTFACASCHPDAGIDQLLWVIGAVCDDPQCDQEEPRSTMPIRGLRETLPLHWDGTLGDPFGGPNGETGVGGSEPANCDGSDPQSCFRQLVDAALSGVMCSQPGCANGPSGLPGELDDTERENMAAFLGIVPYMPARERPLDDLMTASAYDGFADFFMDQGSSGGSGAQSCGDTTGGCHALPLGVSTNSPVVGAFEAPTMRGMNNRFIHFSGGFTSNSDLLSLACTISAPGVTCWQPELGQDEFRNFSGSFIAFEPIYNVFPEDMFQLFEEMSTSFPGAIGKQVTLNALTTLPANLAETTALLTLLEDLDLDGRITLKGEGTFNDEAFGLSFQKGKYFGTAPVSDKSHLIDFAQQGLLNITFTAHLNEHFGDPAHPQPLLATDPGAPATGPTGDPNLPVLSGPGPITMTIAGIDVNDAAAIFVDGSKVSGNVVCNGGTFTPFCSSELIDVTLDVAPPNGLHLLQLLDDKGPMSNEMGFCMGSGAGCL